MIVVDLRPFTAEIFDDDVRTRDGASVALTGVIEGQVLDPIAAATRVVDYRKATGQIFQTAIRAALKERFSADIAAAMAELESSVTEVVDGAVRGWGVSATSAAITLVTPGTAKGNARKARYGSNGG